MISLNDPTGMTGYFVPFARLSTRRKNVCSFQKEERKNNKISIVFTRIAERTESKGKREEKKVKNRSNKNVFIHELPIWIRLCMSDEH